MNFKIFLLHLKTFECIGLRLKQRGVKRGFSNPGGADWWNRSGDRRHDFEWWRGDVYRHSSIVIVVLEPHRQHDQVFTWGFPRGAGKTAKCFMFKLDSPEVLIEQIVELADAARKGAFVAGGQAD